MSPALRLGAATTMALVAFWPAPSQAASAPAVRQQRPDAQGAVREARDAQQRFERQRLRLVSVDRTGRWGGSCDEVLGRMCLTLGEVGDWWPAPDPPELVDARERLIETLDFAATSAPTDGWVAGQRVVYLGEAGRWSEALDAARDCRAREPGWCDALTGYALHGAGRHDAAAEAFERALSQMDAADARAWRDIEPLLDDQARDLLDAASAGGDETARAFIERAWLLADPLFLVEGNDRHTEHYARRVLIRAREDARNPFGMPWGRDLAELVLRYGAEVGWQRSLPRPGELLTQGSMLGHHHPYTRGHMPPGDALRAPATAGPELLNPGGRVQARSGYAAPYAPVILPAPAQVALLPQGDSVRVVARIAMPHDTTYHAGHGHPPLPLPAATRRQHETEGLFLVPLDGGPVRGVRRVVGEGPGGLSVTAPAGEYVVSVERWSPAEGHAGRLRRGVSIRAVVPDVPTLSDLLVASGGADRPAPGGLATSDDLDALVPHLLLGDSVRAGDTLHVGWQLDGLGWRREAVALGLRLERTAGGLLRRAGRALGLVGDPPSVELTWVESGPDRPGPWRRTVLLVLPPDLPGGRYELRLHASFEGREALEAVRTLHVGP